MSHAIKGADYSDIFRASCAVLVIGRGQESLNRMIWAITEARSSCLPPFDHFSHAPCWMRMHFPAVSMIAVIGRIENEWRGPKLTIDDSKSFTNYVHVVKWFPESFPVDDAMDLARFVQPFFLQFFKFLGVSMHDNNMSTFAVCFIFRNPFFFTFAAVDYDSSVIFITPKEWIWLGRNVNRFNAEFLSFAILWTDLKRISTFFYVCR